MVTMRLSWTVSVIYSLEDIVTVGLGTCGFLLVVHRNHASILHRYLDVEPPRFWGHGPDLLGSCDVIGHVTIKLRLCGFLSVVYCNHASVLHRYGNMEPQTFWGHVVDLLGSRDVIGHVTIRLRIWGFL